MRNNALYFPYISIPDTAWTMRTLLYWDKLSAIVPLELAYRTEELDVFMRELLDAELVNTVIPAQYLWRLEQFDNSTEVPRIPVVLGDTPRLGQRVFLAGYSEELRLPFDIDRLLLPETKGAAEFKSTMDKGYMADMTGPLIKQGYIGNLRRIVTTVSGLGNLECDVMYIDNAMHPGASGGPVFNEQGEAIGVLSQRAMTAVEYGADGRARVPSGCTIAIGLNPLAFLAGQPNASN